MDAPLDTDAQSLSTRTKATATLAFAFGAEPGDAYLDPDWGVAQKHELKQAVTDEIFARIPLALRDRWKALEIDVDEHGCLPETEIRDHIRAQLASMQGFRLGLVDDAEAAPETVVYCWLGDTRVCKHSYAIEVLGDQGAPPAAWTVTRHPAGTARAYTARLFTMLAWETQLG